VSEARKKSSEIVAKLPVLLKEKSKEKEKESEKVSLALNSNIAQNGSSIGPMQENGKCK